MLANRHIKTKAKKARVQTLRRPRRGRHVAEDHTVCPDFRVLMKEHILGARQVLLGKLHAKKSEANRGVKMLNENTIEWSHSLQHLTGSPEKGEAFAEIWGEHVKLEGKYIDAMFACDCKTMDFGLCEEADSAQEAIQELKVNGRKVVDFLNREFGNEQTWTDLWLFHLQCVKEFIDMARQVFCNTRTMDDFENRVHHCIEISEQLGDEFNSLRHNHHS